ncbi:ATPase AAA [Bifidobacterium myosotis]|uniref:ATPase AAA n=1 Tax=Bifidobacterium myosotis TaxID=1630166 RepID=A0A261FQH2_9BIFI|nr:ATP-binding protein [Bifidobacterium myosotis]OZG61036.1 ATPase AAA [Bifidobacterium myosotis]
MGRLHESATIEFKRQLNDAAKREIVAFANSEGGDLYIGIDDDGIPVGVDDPDAVMGGIGDMIRNAIRPDLTAYTSIECESMEDGAGVMRNIVHVTVLRGVKRPYYLTGKGMRPTGVFIRHGVSAVPASEERIRQMIRDDDVTAFDASVSIDQDLTFNEADAIFARQQVPWGKPQQRSLGLINSDGLYTNAAALISDQCRHTIKCAVYQGNSKARFLARQEFQGSLLQQLDDVCRYLELNNPIRSDIVGLYRNDTYAYPPAALREALLNAVVHRDYDYSGPTLVSIYADRIDFVSLGGLVKGITLTDLTNGISQPRNTVLANTFYRLELMESYGSGIPKIMEEYAGNSESPIIRITPSAFTLSLPRLDGTGNGGNPVHANPTDGPDISDWFTARNPFPSGPAIQEKGNVQIAVLNGYPTGKGVGTLTLEPAASTTSHIDGGSGTEAPTDDATRQATRNGRTAIPSLLPSASHTATPSTPQTNASNSSSTLEELTLALIRSTPEGISRLEIQQRLGVNKNRAAYALRKLEHAGRIMPTGTARNTRYVAA